MTAEQPFSILFADVSGSTKLYETSGDAIAHAAIGKCVELMIRVTKENEGRVVKTVGDEVMAEFSDPNQATSAAMDMQNGIEAFEPVGTTRLGVRIGYQHGPVVHRDGDVFGDTVNLAARLAEVAIKGQIITTRTTVELLNPMLRGVSRRLHSIEVKGKAEPIPICEIVWRDSDEATTLVANRTQPTSLPTMLRLTIGSRMFVLDAGRRSIGFGREKTAELVVDDPNASRAHGKIELRMGKFVLTDHSANGTYVAIEGDRRQYILRREDFTLRGRGHITCGQPKTTATEIIEYLCE